MRYSSEDDMVAVSSDMTEDSCDVALLDLADAAVEMLARSVSKR